MTRTIAAKSKAPAKTPDIFRVVNGVLKADADLYWEFIEEFDAACGRLLETRKQRLEVDLASVNFISSSFVGCLCTLVTRASRKGKRVVVKVSEDVSWLFDIMGGRKLLDWEVV